MKIYATVEVPEYLLQQLHRKVAINASLHQPNAKFILDEDTDLSQIFSRLKNASDSEIVIRFPSSDGRHWDTRYKNLVRYQEVENRASDLEESEFVEYLDADDPRDVYEPTPITEDNREVRAKDIIRNLASGKYPYRYSGSFFTSHGELMHEFKDIVVPGVVDPHDSKSRLYIKFIAPRGVIDEKEIYREYEDKILDGQAMPITEDQVRSGGDKWDVVSFHNSYDNRTERQASQAWRKRRHR